MAHRALTLKYRPQVFSDLVGQEHVTQVLSAALASGRVAQAFLFTGARGVGKTTSARILAKALNCPNLVAAPVATAKGKKAAAAADALKEPCGTCTSCTEIASGVSLDVLEIDGASNRGIADVQQLRESVRFAPTGGRYRVVIIDEVHQLSGDAFAALLKTLEEPPAHLVFIFATTDPQKLPDTIRSRTQRFDFARVAIRRVADRLLEIAAREQADADGVKFELQDGAALLIAHKGEGSMRDAVSALDQVVSAGEPVVDESLVRRVLGIPDREVFFRVAGAVIARDPQATLRELHEAFAKGQDPRELAEGLAEHFRDILVVKVDPEKGHDLVAASNEDLDRLKQQGAGWADADLLRLMRLAAECQWPMRDSPQPLVHLEAAVLQMATLEPAESIATLLDRLEQLERRLGGGAVSAIGNAPARSPGPSSGPRGFMTPAAPAVTSAPTDAPRDTPPGTGFTAPSAIAPRPTSAPATPSRPAPPPVARAAAPTPSVGGDTESSLLAEARLDETVRTQWSTTLAAIDGRSRMLGAFLEDISLVGATERALVLAMDDLQRSVVDTGEHRPLIQEELARTFGRPMELRVVRGQSKSGERRDQVRRADLQPIIDRAIRMFDGEMIDRAARAGESQS